MFENLICDNCKTSLSFSDNYLSCEKCKNNWPIIDGIPHFLNHAFFWAEKGITQDDLISLNQELSNSYWKDALRGHPSKALRNYYKFYTNSERVKWHRLLPLKKESTILDLGAGMGTISEVLAKNYDHVIALEPVQERLEFMQNRFKQEKLDNITLIRSDASFLPFPKNSFDLVILNGLLEWIPLMNNLSNPQDLQINFLKKVFQLLKRDGFIYLGIENRTCYSYFSGAKDPHCSVKYVTILPRKIADIYSKYKTGESYRNYIYSSRGLRNILKKTGFKNISVYSSLPSYNNPVHIIPLKHKSNEYKDLILPSQRWEARMIKWILIKLNLLKYFGYAYIVLAQK